MTIQTKPAVGINTSVRLDADMYALVKEAAVKEQRSIGFIINRTLKQVFDKTNGKKNKFKEAVK